MRATLALVALAALRRLELRLTAAARVPPRATVSFTAAPWVAQDRAEGTVVATLHGAVGHLGGRLRRGRFLTTTTTLTPVGPHCVVLLTGQEVRPSPAMDAWWATQFVPDPDTRAP